MGKGTTNSWNTGFLQLEIHYSATSNARPIAKYSEVDRAGSAGLRFEQTARLLARRPHALR